jgi:hypothetical protein
MRENVPDSPEEGLVVQDGFGRVTALPEGSLPADEPAHLLADVRPKVLHEARQIPPGCSNKQMNVVRGKGEGEDLHSGQACAPG